MSNIDLTKMSTRRLLAYKKKHYNYRSKCCIYDYECDACSEDDISTECINISDCIEYWKEYDRLKDELSKREHIEN